MSRFGPARGSTDRNPSPEAKRSTSPLSSPKKKAFVSTIKSVETFGTPPPLPALQASPDGKWNLDLIVPDISHGVADPDSLSSSHVHLLQRQTVRWLNLSLNLWSLTVLDVYRTVTIESIAQFLEVVSWRAHGKVTAEEFSVLYSEWVAKPDKAPTSGKRVTVGVFGVRQLLLEKKYAESDLDLCIGIIINEINMRLLNSSVSYVGKKGSSGAQQNPFSLEVCSAKWLSLCDELFFTLDTPGYGVLRFDEAFFYCACVTVGMQGWDCEEDLEADLSLATLTATTLQFLSDAGAHLSVRSSQQQESELAWTLDAPSTTRSLGGSGRKSQLAASQLHSQAQSGRANNGKCEITLAMFKRYFLKRNVGEASLALLLAHVQGCVERIVRLARVNGADELYAACKPYETELGSIGSARLWQQAVLSASGHVYTPSTADSVRAARASGATADASGGAPGSAGTPPIILFLLSDAERLLSGALRANELPTDGTGFIAGPGESSGASLPGQMEPASAANEELHESVYRIWNQFRRWGDDSGSGAAATSAQAAGRSAVWGLGAGNLHNPVSFYGQGSQGDLADVQRDPLYQLILTAVLQYKSMQQLLLAAFFDMTLSHFGIGDSLLAQSGGAGPLVVTCAGLVPNPQRILVELGFTEGPSSSWEDPVSGGVTGMRSASTPTKSGVEGLGDAPLMTSIDSPVIPSPQSAPASEQVSEPSRTAGAAGNASSAGGLPVPPPRRRRAAQQEAAPAAALSDSEPVAPSTGSEKNRLAADTASSAARNRASQRIQEQRRNLSGGESAYNSSVEDEMAQAKWSPLFSSKKATSPGRPAAGIAETKSERRPPAQSATSAPAAQTATAAPARGSHSLSDEEGSILAEILSTSDIARQNQLIAYLKQLRVGGPADAPVKPEGSRAQAATASRDERSGSEASGFGQFQKLEENALNEHDRRLKSGSSQPAEYSSPKRGVASGSNQPATPDSSTARAPPSAPSDAAASAGPSSIEELLQQGQGTGQYAQMLREILRKMSRDDSTLQLKSLEQVLQLGHSIAQQDSQERLNEARMVQNRENRSGRTPSPRRAGSFSGAAAAPSSSAAAAPASAGHQGHNNSFSDHSHDRYGAEGYTPRHEPQGAARNGAAYPAMTPVVQPRSSNGAITRLAKVPGQTPNASAKSGSKKVFGHAVK